VKELETEISSVKEKHQQEIDRILNEKQEEIEKVKSEAERTTGGLRKLYRSLQV
jgi:archaellum component FlaC